MQLLSYWKSDRFIAIYRNSGFAVVLGFILIGLTACGGNPSSTMAATQPPAPVMTPSQPADPPSSGSGSSGSGSSSGSAGGKSAPSGGSSSNNPSPSNNPPAPPGVPAGAQTYSAVQTMPNWLWCTQKLNGHVCAAGLGVATSSMTPNQASPSMSGASSWFQIGGKTAYSNALWWHSFGPNTTPTHLVYDLYFYMQDPSSPEALEFDVNQSMDGVRYIWGSECSYRNTGYWDIWNDESGRWETTSVPCPVVSANTWHHLTWQIERVNGQAHYISVTLDGNVGTVDKYYNPQQNYNGSDLNVAFQMDGDSQQNPYSVWLDDVSLSAW